MAIAVLDLVQIYVLYQGWGMAIAILLCKIFINFLHIGSHLCYLKYFLY